MNKNIIFRVLIQAVVLTAVSGCVAQNEAQNSPQNETQFNSVTNIAMKIESPAFTNNGLIPSKYTCDGENISPPLTISAVPSAAKSLVLILDDPDAPSGDFVHWTVWNIAPGTAEIKEDSVPPGGVQGKTDGGTNKWVSPCPPSGVHHYQFKLYALDSTLDISASSKKKDIENAMNAHVLDQAVLVGLFQRK